MIISNKMLENSNKSICNKCGKKYNIGHSSPIGFLCKKCSDNFPCPECNRPRNAVEKARQNEREEIYDDLSTRLWNAYTELNFAGFEHFLEELIKELSKNKTKELKS